MINHVIYFVRIGANCLWERNSSVFYFIKISMMGLEKVEVKGRYSVPEAVFSYNFLNIIEKNIKDISRREKKQFL